MNEEQSKWVAEFSAWGVQLQAYTELELVYRQNMILAELGAQSMVEQPVTAPSHSLSDLTTWLLATRQDLGPEAWQQDIARARLLNIVTPSPDKLQANFKQLYAESPERAVSYYYELSRAVENVKVADIERNIQYLAASSFGELEITINLSKPEKTTAEIAAAAKAPKSSYPPTALDYTNEGFAGSVNQPARSTHRFIRDDLQGKTWGWHYSPYAYFEEHAIFVDFVREQMTIDAGTFTDLLAIVAKYPMYFVGSNADLPIVGGSILSQEHFQGGRYVFPLMLAPTELPVDLPDFPTVTAAFIKWPMTTLLLTSTSREYLVAASERVRLAWEGYSDPELSINAVGPTGERQHTVTPIARQEDGKFMMYLVLRDNGTSAEFPDGIFHPHADIQHIKRENIGLIEVMGLAILPARLKDELEVVSDFLLGDKRLDAVAEIHQDWAAALKEDAPANADDVQAYVRQAVGHVFERVLTDAGVYKYDAAGRDGLRRFIAHMTMD